MEPYKQAFQNLSVPDDMLDRIAGKAKQPHRRTAWKPAWISLAACLTIALGLWSGWPKAQPQPDQVGVLITNPRQTVEGPEALADALPFTPFLPSDLPEGYAAGQATVISGAIAEVLYTDGEGQVRYRMGQGEQDVSGDFTAYAQVSTPISPYSVTLKGAEGRISLAVWTQDGYSFSLFFSPAVTQDQALNWVERIMGGH